MTGHGDVTTSRSATLGCNDVDQLAGLRPQADGVNLVDSTRLSRITGGPERRPPASLGTLDAVRDRTDD